MALLVILSGASVPVARAAQTFFVSPAGNDANPGTEAAPWKTLGRAASALVAGDTAIVMDGLYTEGEIVFGNSGTALLPITMKAQHKHQAVLSSTSGCQPNISIHASYVRIEELRLAIAPTNVPCPSHNSADGTGVRCWHSTESTVAQPFSTFVGCVVRGVRVDPSPARSHAVKTSQDFSLVEHSECYSGLEAFNSYGVVFRHNVVIGGDAWNSSLVAKAGVRNFEAYNNVVKIQNPSGLGVILGGITGNQWLYDPPSGVEAYNSVAYNNVIVNESGGGVDALGMMGARDSALFNNVVIDGRLLLRAGHTGVESDNPVVQNNIVVCSGDSAASQWSYTGRLTVDRNNFHDCANPPDQEHPIVGDPMFVDRRTDWHLRDGSPAIGRGQGLMVRGFKGEPLIVNKDKDGNIRALPWDLGVYATRSVVSDAPPPPPPTNLRAS
jgi:hypothetical protein